MSKTETQESKEYGRQVRRARLSASLTQQQLAEIAEVSRNTVANIELGTTTPQPSVKARIEKALKLDTPTNYDVTSIVASIYVLLDSLPHQIQQQVITEIAELVGKHLREHLPDELPTNSHKVAKPPHVRPARPKPKTPTQDDLTLAALEKPQDYDPFEDNWEEA